MNKLPTKEQPTFRQLVEETHDTVIRPGEWVSIDEWIAAFEAVNDPGGKYGSIGLRGGWLRGVSR